MSGSNVATAVIVAAVIGLVLYFATSLHELMVLGAAIISFFIVLAIMPKPKPTKKRAFGRSAQVELGSGSSPTLKTKVSNDIGFDEDYLRNGRDADD